MSRAAADQPVGNYGWREPTYGGTETWIVWLLWILPILATVVTVLFVALRMFGNGGLQGFDLSSMLHP